MKDDGKEISKLNSITVKVADAFRGGGSFGRTLPIKLARKLRSVLWKWKAKLLPEVECNLFEKDTC